ncbi:hypothetical protein OG413_46170 [Streptomyces sp. NBC_01433]|uniref:hypothetical protein n=1 Tax=Streptomyces sp. NBC_01433 TaxID=2903864 RepID=UPI0022527A3D|nr:hypothetical protein [Streptomyces sp. NBC_01433]MCX4682574.1 hypothetical protein [Streptomyces sp. NBC_01433]
MTITGHTPACRVDLDKRPARYLVIVDDRDAYTSWAEHSREDRLPQRRVVYVERQVDHPVVSQLRWDELEGDCRDAGGYLSLLTYTAVSYAHAAFLARREFAVAGAVARMGEVIDGHLEHGDRGWIAIRIADGGSDGELYDGYDAARAAQAHPERCTYLPVSPLRPWTPRMCEEHLEFMNHRQHGCMVRDTPTCH